MKPQAWEDSAAYGFADHVEGDGDVVRLRLDAFPQHQLEGSEETHLLADDGGEFFHGFIRHLRTFVIELLLRRGDDRQLPGMAGRSIQEERWYDIRLGRGGDGVPARVYEAPEAQRHRERSIVAISPVDGRTSLGRALFATTRLDRIPDASPFEMRQVLEGAVRGKRFLVAAYHVGQGNCNALCDTAGSPLLYFDFGGGCLANAATYPDGQRYCFMNEPPVVLSHWDMDHWVAARHFPAALMRTWIVPRQRLGPTHQKLVQDILQRGRLLVFPTTQVVLPFSAGAVIHCSGRGRNDSGLALYTDVRDLSGAKSRCLLPGDAAYKCVASVQGPAGELEGLVASHHGGDRRGNYPPAASAVSSIVYSYGSNNTYSHPDEAGVWKHETRGWTYRLNTPDGHSLVGCPGHSPPVQSCAAATCDLQLTRA